MINGLYKKFLKRFIDLILASFCLIIILPFVIILLPIVSLSNRGPIFFTQLRPGLNGKLFRFAKLKTMNDNLDESGKPLPDSLRLTHFGRFIRSFSIDEFPQFINIIRGEMSLIGPRPLLPDYLPLYNAFQNRRHEVRPGMTGWAQVNGRNTLTWEQKFQMDVWYVDNLSFKIDMKILFLTLMKVLKRDGINSASTATMERFTGN